VRSLTAQEALAASSFCSKPTHWAFLSPPQQSKID
jgi:hypothetical protein